MEFKKAASLRGWSGELPIQHFEGCFPVSNMHKHLAAGSGGSACLAWPTDGPLSHRVCLPPCLQ